MNTSFPAAGAMIAAMRREKLDALIVTSPENFHYTVGVALTSQRLIPERLAMAVWRTSGESTVLVEGLEEEVTRRRGRVADIRTYGEHREGAIAALAKLMRALGLEIGRVGIESRSLVYASMRDLAAALPHVEFVPCDEIFDTLRLEKSTDEQGRIRTAAQLIDDVILLAAKHARVGLSEREVGTHMVNELTARSGGRLTGIGATVASGPNAHVTHHGMADRALAEGDLVRLGGRGIYEGYHAIVMRTGTVGRPAPAVEKAYRDLFAIHSEVIAQLHPGTPAREVYGAAERAYTARGHALPLPHVGHSIGLSLQERPKFQPGAAERLVSGMTCVVVTVLATPHGRFYLEDCIAVDTAGPRALSCSGAAENLLAIG